ncbi:MAG: 5-formyltetrahydrofolate cyclo-ligase [Chitinispirillaceae bacterium]|nr:5-formyltetrahydrofolate cyclo-ligase [Chitinispirillaceae bacterium]
MNTGFGFSEMLLIVTLVVIFFGSKELPALLREIARMTARLRRYSDRIKRELDDVTRSLEPQQVPFAEQQAKKKELRAFCISARKKLGAESRAEKSSIIRGHLVALEELKNATMIMMYAEMGAEVITLPAIRRLLSEKKRIILPYGIDGTNDLGIAEIHEADTDIVVGKNRAPEPAETLRKTFFRSDLEAVVCPGVAFDYSGGRLGRGRGCYDSFLRELRGKIPLIGLAFDCQMLHESLPFEYHDVAMDKVLTESGIVAGGGSAVTGKSDPLRG